MEDEIGKPIYGFYENETPTSKRTTNANALWFEQNFASLCLKYPNQYVAVQNGSVLATASSSVELLSHVMKVYGEVAMYVGFAGIEPVGSSGVALAHDEEI